MRLPLWDQPRGKEIHDDAPWWETPDDFDDVGVPLPKRDALLNVTAEEKV